MRPLQRSKTAPARNEIAKIWQLQKDKEEEHKTFPIASVETEPLRRPKVGRALQTKLFDPPMEPVLGSSSTEDRSTISFFCSGRY